MQLPMLLRLSPLLQCPSLTPTLVWSGLVGLGFSVPSLSLSYCAFQLARVRSHVAVPFLMMRVGADDASRSFNVVV